jgi:hypothetical protein
MDYFSQRLSDLRKEIANLRTNNASYSHQTEHSENEQVAYELRSTRLLQIKKELSGMLNRPQEGPVWWERFRSGARP